MVIENNKLHLNDTDCRQIERLMESGKTVQEILDTALNSFHGASYASIKEIELSADYWYLADAILQNETI